jgi:hypothetical protein
MARVRRLRIQPGIVRRRIDRRPRSSTYFTATRVHAQLMNAIGIEARIPYDFPELNPALVIT